MANAEYIAHWSKRGIYGLERIRRMDLRKMRRKEKDNRLCKCGHNRKENEHTCPYAEEMNDDHESLCNCCRECTHECAMDI